LPDFKQSRSIKESDCIQLHLKVIEHASPEELSFELRLFGAFLLDDRNAFFVYDRDPKNEQAILRKESKLIEQPAFL